MARGPVRGVWLMRAAIREDQGVTADQGQVFSVITTTLNDLCGLKRTWASLVAQGDAAVEWVVIDGGSSDGSVEWLGSLDQSMVRWVSEEDAGIYDAMNTGLARACGDLIVFLGAGDRLAPGALSLVREDYARQGWSWAYGLSRIVTADGDLVQVASFVPFRRRWLELGYRALNHQACFFSRDLVESLGAYDLRYPIFADQEFCLRAAAIAHPRVLGNVVAEFVTGGTSWALPAGSFVWPARAMRKRHRRLVGGNSAIDLMATIAVWLDLRSRDTVTRLLHRGD